MIGKTTLFRLKILVVSLFVLIICFKTKGQEPEHPTKPKTGTASYYSSRFNGRHTSSGEIFNNKLYTAAHRSLPFGTYVLVTNKKNDKSVIVKINDRFYPRKGHILDISLAAANEIDLVRYGRAFISMEVIDSSKVVGLIISDSIKSNSVTYKLYSGEINIFLTPQPPMHTIQLPFIKYQDR